MKRSSAMFINSGRLHLAIAAPLWRSVGYRCQ